MFTWKVLTEIPQVSWKSWALHSALCRQGLRSGDFGAQLRDTKADSKEQTPFTLTYPSAR